MCAYSYTFLHFKNELEVMYLEYSFKQCTYMYARVCISEVNILILPQCSMPYWLSFETGFLTESLNKLDYPAGRYGVSSSLTIPDMEITGRHCYAQPFTQVLGARARSSRPCSKHGTYSTLVPSLPWTFLNVNLNIFRHTWKGQLQRYTLFPFIQYLYHFHLFCFYKNFPF